MNRNATVGIIAALFFSALALGIAITLMFAPRANASGPVSIPASTEAHACHEMVLWSRGQTSLRAVVSAASRADDDIHRAILAVVATPRTDRARFQDVFWNAMVQCGYGS